MMIPVLYFFLQKKAGYIKKVSQILLDQYGGDIPSTMDQLVSYSTAAVFMWRSQVAFSSERDCVNAVLSARGGSKNVSSCNGHCMG